MVKKSRRVSVVLFQLGGPDTLEAIEPFLFNLFCDPDIIDFPFARIGRKALAKLISTTRARKVQHHYSVIGGGSPIRKLTEMQACALQIALAGSGIDATCVVAMRYWHPFTDEAIAQLDEAGYDDIVLLPLYPQYSSTTTGSSMNEWHRRFRGSGVPVYCVKEFHRHELYLDSVIEKIDEAMMRFAKPKSTCLVFSAHSVPVAVVEQGDPYRRHIEATVQLVMERGNYSNQHRLCYQSKVGASKWLQPSLRSTLQELAMLGIDNVCVVPISFVSDHVETLGEIDHEAREQAAKLGIKQFEMTSGLNDSPTFIAALADLVGQAIGVDVNRQEAVERFVAAD